MIQAFLDTIESRIDLSEEEQGFVRKKLVIKTFQKGDFLLQAGEVSRAFYFNLEGFIRLFYIHHGEEKTAYFYPPLEFVSAYESFVKEQPSNFYLQAMQTTQVVEISKESAYALLEYSPKFEVLARIAMEEELMANQKIISMLVCLSPEERFLYLQNEHPAFFQELPQHYIASFMGIKAESLSRIKKRILDKRKS